MTKKPEWIKKWKALKETESSYTEKEIGDIWLTHNFSKWNRKVVKFIYSTIKEERESLKKEVEKMNGNACYSGMCGHGNNLDANAVEHGKYIGKVEATKEVLNLINNK